MRNIGSRLRESNSLIVRPELRGCLISGELLRLNLDVFGRRSRGCVEGGAIFGDARNNEQQKKCLVVLSAKVSGFVPVLFTVVRFIKESSVRSGTGNCL